MINENKLADESKNESQPDKGDRNIILEAFYLFDSRLRVLEEKQGIKSLTLSNSLFS